MNNQRRSVSFDARAQGRGVVVRTMEGNSPSTAPAQPLDEIVGEPAVPTMSCVSPSPGDANRLSTEMRQKTSGDQKLNGLDETPVAEEESLHSRASPYNLRWTIRR